MQMRDCKPTKRPLGWSLWNGCVCAGTGPGCCVSVYLVPGPQGKYYQPPPPSPHHCYGARLAGGQKWCRVPLPRVGGWVEVGWWMGRSKGSRFPDEAPRSAVTLRVMHTTVFHCWVPPKLVENRLWDGRGFPLSATSVLIFVSFKVLCPGYVLAPYL